MSILLLAVVVVFLFILWNRVRGASSAPSSSGAIINNRRRPAAVPAAVWNHAPAVVSVASEIGYPLPPAWALATIWQESTGRKNANGAAGEVGLGQMLPIALEDVRNNFPQHRADLPETIGQLDRSSARTQIKAFMLFQKLQATRCRGHRAGQIECTLRSYNSGYPPNMGPTHDYWTEVRRKREQIGELSPQ